MKTSHCPGKLMTGMATHTSYRAKLPTTGPRHHRLTGFSSFVGFGLPGKLRGVTPSHLSLTRSLTRSPAPNVVCLVGEGALFYHYRVGWYRENSYDPLINAPIHQQNLYHLLKYEYGHVLHPSFFSGPLVPAISSRHHINACSRYRCEDGAHTRGCGGDP